MPVLSIVADENISNVKAIFSSLGHVTCVDGRHLSNAQLCQLKADILLVRSITKVDRALLSGTNVKFVASATIGLDHLDTQYLDENGIAWANAPGSNADSVVEYVISALCRIDGALETLFSGGSLGIIGMGNVGSRLYQRLTRLGIRCKGYDPLIPQNRYAILQDLSSVLLCDVVCCHTPLTIDGPYPTKHLLNEETLQQLPIGAVLINAGRGGVVDNQALKQCLAVRPELHVILDVWENEPSVDPQLFTQITYGTAHIAGYSFDGKRCGTEMIYQACCQFLGEIQRAVKNNAAPAMTTITLTQTQSVVAGIKEAVLSSYDIAEDDKRLRDACHQASDSSAQRLAFDQLRKLYPMRREIAHFRIGNTHELSPALCEALLALGFNLGTV